MSEGTDRRTLLLGLLGVGTAMLLPQDSDGRVGGGHSRSSSRRSSSRRSSSSSRRSSSSRSSSSSSRRSSSGRSSSGRSSSGSGDGSGILFGLPMGLLFIVMVVLNNIKEQKARRMDDLLDDPDFQPQTVGRSPRTRQKDRTPFADHLRKHDPTFSDTLFRDHALLVYTRAFSLIRHRAGAGLLSTLLSPRAVQQLQESLIGWTRIGLVTIGHHTVHREPSQDADVLVVTFFGNVRVSAGSDVVLDREERWTFSRPGGAQSPGPDKLRALSCPSCGSTADPGLTGACPSCGTARTEGSSSWRVTRIVVDHSERAPDLHISLGGGREPGLDNATVRHPKVAQRKKAFEARHPDTTLAAEVERLSAMFVQLQSAWTKGRWEEARPLMSDALFTANQGWLDQLDGAGMRNRTVGMKVSRMDVCDVQTDAWVESVTVRVYASCLDWTERKDTGEVCGGSNTERRIFSEYWTFVRTIGARRESTDLQACPSCGAPLDKMSMSGVCGYCDSKVSHGDFDWVATRISQDDDVVGIP